MKRLIVAAVLCLAVVAPVHADVITEDFDILNGALSPSGGTITFSLNLDGTISATLHSISNVYGFAFDSIATNLPESNFSPWIPTYMSGWIDMYGYHPTGFACFPGYSCDVTTDWYWTIGTPGQFTSVLEALGGGHAQYPFFLLNDDGQWAAGAPTPEPTTLALLGLGLAGLTFSRRRKQ